MQYKVGPVPCSFMKPENFERNSSRVSIETLKLHRVNGGRVGSENNVSLFFTSSFRAWVVGLRVYLRDPMGYWYKIKG